MEAAFRQILNCCCLATSQANAQQLTYEHPKLEELHTNRPLPVPAPPAVGEKWPNLHRLSPRGLGQGFDPMMSARSGATVALSSRESQSESTLLRSGAALSPEEERKKEKDRLHDLVKEFAKSVVQGLSCQLLTSTAGAPRACVYSFDKALRLFTVKADGETPLSLELGSVLEVKKDVKNTPFSKLHELPPPHAVSGEQLEKRVACLVYQVEQEQKLLVLLMPNPYERERFYTCMCILRWALVSRESRSG
eukprot:gb/GFBE01057992.1/.p1 GENE.gb/GFBE01057992.1/~~gb/GFBE01057992.1/.p1  ORF type:complete len:250 (+),score=57.17 gb/GFBE01057992.1/:1-750(+)